MADRFAVGFATRGISLAPDPKFEGFGNVNHAPVGRASSGNVSSGFECFEVALNRVVAKSQVGCNPRDFHWSATMNDSHPLFVLRHGVDAPEENPNCFTNLASVLENSVPDRKYVGPLSAILAIVS